MPDFRNPHNFKLISNKISEVPDSPLLCIGLAFNSGQYYAALVDPGTKKNYVLYANLNSLNPKKGIIYREIDDEREHKAVSDYFLKVGVYELYYKGRNWIFPRVPDPSNPKSGTDMIPPWFKDKYINL